jgi:hypothetical protein
LAETLGRSKIPIHPCSENAFDGWASKKIAACPDFSWGKENFHGWAKNEIDVTAVWLYS